jgi:hypothetical protein
LKKLGFRSLMDVISLDSSLVRGTPGRLAAKPADGPVLISSSRRQQTSCIRATDVSSLILDTLFS